MTHPQPIPGFPCVEDIVLGDGIAMRPQLRAWCEANLRATERFELLGRRMVLYQRREIPFAAARP